MIYHRICDKSNPTFLNIETRAAYPTGAPDCISGFYSVRFVQSFIFRVVFYRLMYFLSLFFRSLYCVSYLRLLIIPLVSSSILIFFLFSVLTYSYIC